MIYGTSEILSKHGPVDLPTITKMLQRMQETDGDILENIIFGNMGLIFKCSKHVACAMFCLRVVFFVEQCVHIFKIILWR